MIVGWFIIVIEDELSSTSDDSLGRCGNCKAIDFVKWAIERLDGDESSNVPNLKHSRDVSRH